MYLMALWGRNIGFLTLVRDKVGKPLNYEADRKRLVFGSEFNELRAHPDLKLNVSKGAIAGLLTNYVSRLLKNS